MLVLRDLFEHREGDCSGDLRRPDAISGFKREFDPGSESTLAACLTHASRTRKRGQLRE